MLVLSTEGPGTTSKARPSKAMFQCVPVTITDVVNEQNHEQSPRR